MSRRLGIAGLQLEKSYTDQEKNLSYFTKLVKSKKKQFPWIDMFITGETFFQDYSSSNLKKLAQEIPNEITNRLSELSRSLGVWMVPGSFLEKDGNEVYNTAIVINPQGEILTKYRKIYPWAPHEDTDWGDQFTTFDIPSVGSVGIAICYDLWFPEIIRTLTWKGAEVVIVPSLTCTSDRPAELVLAQAHAIMFQCYMININCVCRQSGGRSIFIGPEGDILQQAGEAESIMTQVIDFDRVRWIRQYGSFGMNPLWKSFRESKIQGRFPPYLNLREGQIFKDLDELVMHSNVRKWKPVRKSE